MLYSMPFSVFNTDPIVVAHGFSYSVACGTFPDLGSNPCLLHWQVDSSPLSHWGSPASLFGASQVALVAKNLPASAGDAGLIPGSGRRSGKGNGSSLQDSCLENPTDRGAWTATVHGVTKESNMTDWLNDNIKLLPMVVHFFGVVNPFEKWIFKMFRPYPG